MPIQTELLKVFSEGRGDGASASLQEQFCILVGEQFEQTNDSSGAADDHAENDTPVDKTSFDSLKSEEEERQDVDDGEYLFWSEPPSTCNPYSYVFTLSPSRSCP